MEPDINNIQVSGQVTSDPRYTKYKTGKSLLTFTLLNHRVVIKSDGTECQIPSYLEVNAWDEVADVIGEVIQRDMRCHVSGCITFRRYKDHTNGTAGRLVIVPDSCEVLESSPAELQAILNDDSNQAAVHDLDLDEPPF